jgi:hypothetical protein
MDVCASGRELSAMGFPEEAAIAAALDADDHASVMEGGMFVGVRPSQGSSRRITT